MLRRGGRLLSSSLAFVLIGAMTLTFAGASSNWLPQIQAGSHGEGAARTTITSATANPVTFTALCSSSTSETVALSWSSAGSGVTGYALYVSSSSAGTYALDTTQPSGTAVSVNETYTSSTGKKYYRLEAKSANWAFPGTTITNAREANVAGTNGGYITIASTGTECSATA